MSNTRNRSSRSTAQSRAAAAAASRREAQRPARARERVELPELPVDIDVDEELEPDEQDDDEDVSPARAQEIETDGYVGASLCGRLIRIIPPTLWRQSWQRLLSAGQNDEFAELAIHRDDLDEYFELDATNAEIGQFIADAGELSGESLGKSRGPNRSSRSTRRR